jgi:hypothetical protein
MAETWIVYKVQAMDASGWEQRQLMPSGGLTDLLSEEWDSSGGLPAVGDRVRAYSSLEDPGNGVTHGGDGDWVVSRIQTFEDADSGDRVVICYCNYSPIPESWEELRRGVPVEEMLLASK